jgi:hypothetical protein
MFFKIQNRVLPKSIKTYLFSFFLKFLSIVINFYHLSFHEIKKFKNQNGAFIKNGEKNILLSKNIHP